MSASSPIQALPTLTFALTSGGLTTAEPIIDLRPSLGWKRRLPAQLLTAGLWGVGLYLAALPFSRLPASLTTAAALGGVSGLPLVSLVARRSSASSLEQPKDPVGAPSQSGINGIRRDPPRQELAALVGIDEASLFRGRHARICTVHHNTNGDLVAIQASQPMIAIRRPSRDAHPVG